METSEILDHLYKLPVQAGRIDSVSHFFADGMYVRRSIVPQGEVVKMHVHGYDHITIAFGVGTLITDDGAIEVAPGDVLQIKAGKRHSFIAKTMTIWFCVHPTSEEEARELYAIH